YSVELENMELQKQRVQIEQQLLEAKAKIKEGEKIDRVWMSKANQAYRIKAMQIQENLIKIRKINDMIKQRYILNDRIRERVFIDVVRERINKDTYLDFWTEVDKRTNEEN